MTRYLTPSKVAVLGLVTVYTDAAVPSNALIPILSFIIAQVLPQSASQCDSHLPSATPRLALSISDFEHLTTPFDTTVPGRNLYDKFLDRLWAVTSLHDLHAFFRGLTSLLPKSPARNRRSAPPVDDDKDNDKPTHKIPLTRTSPVGIFVRRAALEFTRLQFDDTVKLWLAYVKFRAPSETAWRKKNAGAGASDTVSAGLSFDANFAELGLEPDSPLVHVVYPDLHAPQNSRMELSTDDMERLLDFQLEKLQSKSFSSCMCSFVIYVLWFINGLVVVYTVRSMYGPVIYVLLSFLPMLCGPFIFCCPLSCLVVYTVLLVYILVWCFCLVLFGLS
jgi:anaphase-promoting complex subunit 5